MMYAKRCRRSACRASEGIVDNIIEAIGRSARTGKIGDGKIFVVAVDQAVRIRTGETGEEAV